MIKLQPLVPTVVEALNVLSYYELRELRNNAIQIANEKPRMRLKTLFRNNVLYYLFSSQRICEWYENYNCTDKHIQALLNVSFKKSRIPDYHLNYYIFANYGYTNEELIAEFETKKSALEYFNENVVIGNFDEYDLVELASYNADDEYDTHMVYDTRI